MSTRNSTPGWIATAALFTGLTAAQFAGCGEGDTQVREYIVPKPKGPAASSGSAPTDAAAAVRTLGAIVPRRSHTWYFKITGHASLVAAERDGFMRFLDGLSFADNPDAATDPEAPAQLPRWTLPPGWVAQGGSGMRFATIMIGQAAHQLELSVIPLPGDSGTMAANIQRWANLIGVKQVTSADIERWVKRIEVDGESAWLADIGGPGGGDDPMAMQPRRAANDRFTYEPPQGWTQQEPGQFLKAKYVLTEGDQTLELSVSSFDAPPTTAGFAAAVGMNLNRWRDQVGLPAVGGQDVMQGVVQMEVSGRPGLLADYKKNDGTDRIVGLIALADSSLWFFKLRGPGALVEKHRSTFDQLIQTAKYETN